MNPQRLSCVLTAAALLLIAALRFPADAGQGAVSLSRDGQEDLTFWVNHNGLDQIDVEGEVGFGDMARLLMRRRSNAPKLQAIRDRFVFKIRDVSGLDMPDLLHPGNPPYVVAQNRIFNLLSTRGGKAVAYKVIEAQPGTIKRTFDGVEATFDVRPLAHLRVNIVDENNRPAAARIYLTAADGLAYAPKGTISRYAALPAEPYFHARGTFELDLPAGDTTIEATRGLEYELVAKHLSLNPQAPTTTTIQLKRWTNMAAKNWYSSDAHIHANYTAAHHQVVTAQDVQLYTHAEDLHYANMMVANSFGAYLHDTALFQGKPHPLSTANHILYWNEEMRNAGLYGHMCLYNLKHLVEPLYTGFAGTPQSDDYPPNFAQAKATRAQGGAVTYAHPGYAPTLDGASARELPVDLALGEIDAMDVLSNNPEEVAIELWYRLLNCGFRLGISAGTDSFTNVADHYTPGAGRVYAHLAGRMSAANWVQAYRQGRTFATNGPMISLKVQNREPGDDLHLSAGPQTVAIALQVDSRIPLDKIELIINGKPLPATTQTITLDRSSWIAARATGPAHRLVLNDTAAFAHTSPVYVYLNKQPIQSRDDAQFYVQWIDGLIQRTQQRGRFSTPERKREVVDLFTRAREIYARKANP